MDASQHMARRMMGNEEGVRSVHTAEKRRRGFLHGETFVWLEYVRF